MKPQVAAGETSTLYCLRCGYDLRGAPADGVCPECGMTVRRSLAGDRELHRGRPAWLHRLFAGTLLILLTPYIGVGMVFAAAAAFAPNTRLPAGWIVALPVVPAVCLTLGVLLLTSRESQFESRQPGNRLRVALRLLSVSSLLIAAGMCQVIRTNGMTDLWVSLTAGLALLLVPVYVLIFVYLRSLARRINNPSLAEHCIIVAVGIALAILMPYAYFGVVWLHLLKPNDWELSFSLVSSVTIGLFLIWSSYLLARIAIEFYKTARAARRSWIAADVSR